MQQGLRGTELTTNLKGINITSRGKRLGLKWFLQEITWNQKELKMKPLQTRKVSRGMWGLQESLNIVCCFFALRSFSLYLFDGFLILLRFWQCECFWMNKFVYGLLVSFQWGVDTDDARFALSRHFMRHFAYFWDGQQQQFVLCVWAYDIHKPP